MTEEQFRILSERLDDLRFGKDGIGGLAASVERLGASIDRLPRLRDIYLHSFKLMAMTFIPLWALLIVVWYFWPLH